MANNTSNHAIISAQAVAKIAIAIGKKRDSTAATSSTSTPTAPVLTHVQLPAATSQGFYEEMMNK